MKTLKTAKTMFRIWFITFLIYNSYFGWNAEPINDAEKICDAISQLLLGASIWVYMTPFFKYLEKRIKEDE